MNKVEKIALQCARDDAKKGYEFSSIKKGKMFYCNMFKGDRWTFSKMLDFKNWNKNLEW